MKNLFLCVTAAAVALVSMRAQAEGGIDPRAFAAQAASGMTAGYITSAELGSVTAGSGSAAIAAKVVTSPGATLAMNFATSGDAVIDVTPNAALTLSLAGGVSGMMQKLTLILRQPSTGGFAVTLPANVRYVGGTTPVISTTAGQVTILTFATDDGGTTYFGGL